MSDTERLINSIKMFHYCSGLGELSDNNYQTIQKVLQLNNSPPHAFLELCRSLSFDEPKYYFDRKASNEVFNILNTLYKNSTFVDSLKSSQHYLFRAINAYESILNIYNDLNRVAYDEDLKMRIFRHPLYIQTCEDCLMNFYRCLMSIMSACMGKDYKTQDTLQKALNVLKKYDLKHAINIDINIRNSINHGKAIFHDDTFIFGYTIQGVSQTKELNKSEYSNLLNTTIDIAGGWLAGFIKFLTVNPSIISTLVSDDNLPNQYEWLKLIYKSKETKVMFVNANKIKTSQLDITVHSSVTNKEKLLTALLEIAKGAYLFFPNYQRFFIKYSHNRSLGGFIFFDTLDLKNCLDAEDNIVILKKAFSQCLCPDIEKGAIDETAYKFHVFPNIRESTWHLSAIQDCSTYEHKRIKANLIIDSPMNKNELKKIIKAAINKTKKLKTPINPYSKVAWGSKEANAVFLNTFLKSKSRQAFSLLPNNNNFVCIAHYYSNKQVPKVHHGGVPISIWEEYKKELFGKINLAWNPTFN